ncbi:fibronectin type III domain-containing protein [Dissulfurirhabdus thermomarina]|uniref:fibronectin type III domain-containing protein n=1 Tax=Dissulfurirhabdus thermomarina TaxID=1765737 RepID=UPI0014707A3B|nr:fibronectin type III domain-containing protein [Dissulfurirhabdus thermomarina]NMX22605.1 fibronectin type III domain-containing protein [Dissulfurirhabdus thermomarina]
MRRGRRPPLAGVLFAALTLAGCGLKDRPVPPGTLAPRPVTDLAATAVPEGLELTWSPPTRDVRGHALLHVESFDLYRAELPPDGCEGCPPAFTAPVSLPYGRRPRPGDKVRHLDRDVAPGHRYVYEVRVVKGWRTASAPSNRLVAAWHPPPGPPAGLAAERRERLVRLSWRRPERWADGRPIDPGTQLAYLVERRAEAEGAWIRLAGPRPGTAFLDRAVRAGRAYRYRVRAVFTFQGTPAVGPPSPEAAAVPEIRLPLPAPRR